MTEEKTHVKIERDKNWVPSEEMIAEAIVQLKTGAQNIWEELKVVEATIGNLLNETGRKLSARLEEIFPDLGAFKMAKLKMQLRKRARKEAGITDVTSHSK